MQEQEKEIFQQYEIRTWNYSPRLYKILGAAAVFNLLALFVMGQGDMLTTRGCDSPMVSRVCQVIDTIYIGSTLLGEDGEFVREDYEKTVLGDSEITYIDVSGEAPPLTYPEGYFALANPESQFMAMQNPTDGFPMTGTYPGIPSNPTTSASGFDLMNTPQVTPTPNKDAVIGKIPTEPFSYGTDPTTTVTPLKNRRFPKSVTPRPSKNNSSPKTLPKLDGDTLAENKDKTKDESEKTNQPPLSSETVTDFKPNKKPLEDFADGVLAKRAEKEGKLDLTKSFMVRMVGELDKDGKLDPKKSGYKQFKPEEQGDQEMVDVAKQAIEAINNSGMFYYLKSQGIDKVDFTLVQDDKQIYAVITSTQKTEERAKTLSSGFRGLLVVAKNLIKEKELITLIEASTVEQKGKNFVFNFTMPKPLVQEMINRKLQEAEAKKKAGEGNEQNSTAQTDNTNRKAEK